MKDNIIEFTIDNSQLYFVLGAVSAAYSKMNDIAKREFIKTLINKIEVADPDCAQALKVYVDALVENDSNG